MTCNAGVVPEAAAGPTEALGLADQQSHLRFRERGLGLCTTVLTSHWEAM